MNRLMKVMLSVMFMVGMNGMAIAGSIDSPGAPTAGSGMYTLQNLYDYIVSGTALELKTGFQEPMTGPTTGTMKSTKEIGDALKTILDQCATTTAANVELGKPFFCTQPGSWGIQTGIAQLVPTPTPTPTQTSTPTLTPTPWGANACSTYTGTVWCSLGNVADSGCWFYHPYTIGLTCNQVCEAQGLVCDTRPYTDNSGCACSALYSPHDEFGKMQGPDWNIHGHCHTGETSRTSDTCGSPAGGDYVALCVCKPL